MPQTAAVLAVGSELLSGQTVNRNAAWLSERLFALGIDTRVHLTVDDVEADIVAGLVQLAPLADLLFVTGGLGPTTDDLTRNAVARWAGEELVFDAGSWEHIVRRFAVFSRTVPETNRQQCYFPSTAAVLTNQAGTANAFTLKAHGKEIWVLPGPPQEIATLWEAHLGPALAQRIPLAARKRLRLWRTIGKGESHLAELVEPLLLDQEVAVAYRAHAPYIELKVRFPEVDSSRHQRLLTALDETLAPWLYESDDENVPKLLVDHLMPFGSIDIYDGATQGNVLELLGPMLRTSVPRTGPVSCATSWEGHDDPTTFVEHALTLNSDSDVALVVAGGDSGGAWALGLRIRDKTFQDVRPAVYPGEAMRSRNLKAIAALAARGWYDMLLRSQH